MWKTRSKLFKNRGKVSSFFVRNVQRKYSRKEEKEIKFLVGKKY